MPASRAASRTLRGPVGVDAVEGGAIVEVAGDGGEVEDGVAAGEGRAEGRRVRDVARGASGGPAAGPR